MIYEDKEKATAQMQLPYLFVTRVKLRPDTGRVPIADFNPLAAVSEARQV